MNDLVLPYTLDLSILGLTQLCSEWVCDPQLSAAGNGGRRPPQSIKYLILGKSCIIEQLNHAELQEHIERMGVVFYERANQGVL